MRTDEIRVALITYSVEARPEQKILLIAKKSVQQFNNNSTILNKYEIDMIEYLLTDDC